MKNILIINTGIEERFQKITDRFAFFEGRIKKPSNAVLMYAPDESCSKDANYRYNCRCANLLVYTGFHSADENTIRISWFSGDGGSDVESIAKVLEQEYQNLKFIPRSFPIKLVVASSERFENKAYISIDCFVKDKEDGWLKNDYTISGFVQAITDGIYNSLDSITDKFSALDINLQASDFGENNMENIEKIVPYIKSIQKDTGLLTSVTLAQFILESGCGCSELFKKSNNCFGMKEKISGNLWYGSVWKDKDLCAHISGEYIPGKGYINMKSNFRKYETVIHCIADHSSYLLNAGSQYKRRYEGINDPENDYKQRCNILSAGSYSQGPRYADSLISIIEKYNLTRYDDNTLLLEQQ